MHLLSEPRFAFLLLLLISKATQCTNKILDIIFCIAVRLVRDRIITKLNRYFVSILYRQETKCFIPYDQSENGIKLLFLLVLFLFTIQYCKLSNQFIFHIYISCIYICILLRQSQFEMIQQVLHFLYIFICMRVYVCICVAVCCLRVQVCLCICVCTILKYLKYLCAVTKPKIANTQYK